MFFIYDCNNNVIGNPNGYRTFRGANQQAESRYAKAYRQIWQAYYAKEAEQEHMPKEHRDNLIYRIEKAD